MEQWREIGQVGGGIVAYAILTKVFEFIRDSRRPAQESSSCKEKLARVDHKTDKILRVLQRLEDKLFP